MSFEIIGMPETQTLTAESAIVSQPEPGSGSLIHDTLVKPFEVNPIGAIVMLGAIAAGTALLRRAVKSDKSWGESIKDRLEDK